MVAMNIVDPRSPLEPFADINEVLREPEKDGIKYTKHGALRRNVKLFSVDVVERK
jgi:hypothetical protein